MNKMVATLFGVDGIDYGVAALIIFFLYFPLVYRFLKFSFRKIINFVSKGRVNYSRASSSLLGALLRGWVAGTIISIITFLLGLWSGNVGVSITLVVAFLVASYSYKNSVGLTFLEGALILLISVGAFGIGIISIFLVISPTLFYNPLAIPTIAIEVLLIWRPWCHTQKINEIERIESQGGEVLAPNASESEGNKVQVRIDASGVWVHGKRVMAIEAGEGGSIYLLYRKGGRTFRVPIKAPSPTVSGAGENRGRLLANSPEEALLLFLSNLKTKEGDEWRPVLDQNQVNTLRKISDQDRLRSFIEEIRDYEKLEKIGIWETEIQGFKVRVEKVEGGDRKSYYQFEVVEMATAIRVYEDGKIAVKHEGKFWRLNPETLRIDAVRPMDD